MFIDFDNKSHTYSINGEIATISVTELLAKHKLAPNYKGARKSDLKASAEVGKAVHEDLQHIIDTKGYEPKTEQGKQFKEYASKNIDCAEAEFKLGYVENGWSLCGTADLIGQLKSGEWFVADHKNTAQFHEEYVSWQVSLLDYMARKLSGQKLNGQPFYWQGATKFYCYHYNKKTGDMQIHELDKVPDTEIRKLIECELNGETYKREVLVVSKELQQQVQEAENYLAEIKKQQELAEIRVRTARQQILELMERQGIYSWETDKIKITYVAENSKIITDTKKLKALYPQVFINCQKISVIKPYVRVTHRSEDNDGE